VTGPEGVPRFVPDASVILKWVLDADDEADRDAALQLLLGWQRGTLELLVPPLWIYEVGNILCLKRSRDAEQALTALRALAMIERTSTALVAEAASLTIRYGVTFYDATYLALARLSTATLITADARFLRRLPPGTPARLLADIQELSGP
jgi:predicted nucleic acid-binding protein